MVLVIEDDGKGFDVNSLETQSQGKGIGLISIKERVESFDGNVTINSTPGDGTEIIVELPIENAENG